MKNLLLLLCLSLSLSSPVFADKAYDYYQQGNYKLAAIEWTKQAKKGSPYAQNRMGEFYRSGKGVTKDLKEAIYWFKESANQDYARAQLHLGWAYYYGKGVTKNYNQALYWWREAMNGKDAEANVEARYWIGLAYYDTQEFYNASVMFKPIANGGAGSIITITRAQYMLGLMYERGEYFDENIEIAKRWYTKASLSEDKKSAQALKRIKNSEKSKEAQAKFDEVKKKAKIAEQKRLAKIAETKRKVEIAEQKRLAKIAETKRQSEIAEKNRLARITKVAKELEIAKQKRIGIKAYREKNYDLAKEELLPVAKSGDTDSQYLLGRIAADISLDNKLALYWYEKVVYRGNIETHWRIADIYSKGGYGVLKNPRKAFNSYKILARNGNSKAQHKLGLLYLKGDGVEESLREASYWVQKSFDNDGNKDAEKTWNRYKLWNH